jgi:hypothetical protein
MTDPDVNRPLAIAEAIDRCSNRLDEDADGFTDCDDWDCQYNPLLKPPAELIAEAGRHPDEGYCQGWRFDRLTATWTPVPFDPDRHAPLLCRWTPRGDEEGL